jgi:hypothetical protein
MARIEVVTGFGPDGWRQYGKRMVDTFAAHWPEEIGFTVYHEEGVELPRGELRMYSEIETMNEFLQRHSSNPIYCGREQAPSRGVVFSDRERSKGYSGKYDAVKWCRQAFAMEDAAQRCPDDCEFIVWLDGDTYTFKDVPADWIDTLMDGADFATLFRHNKPPEIGFQGYRIKSLAARQLIRSWANMYACDIFEKLSDFQSGYILGKIAVGMADGQHDIQIGSDRVDSKFDLTIRSLSTKPKGHVWVTSALAEYTDHLKGDRKRAGVSREMRGRT